MVESAQDRSADVHGPASRLVNRGHFRRAYSLTPDDKIIHEDPISALADACAGEYGANRVSQRSFPPRSDPITDFPVADSEGDVESSHARSITLKQIPIVDVGYVLIDPENVIDARRWIRSEKDSILSRAANGG